MNTCKAAMRVVWRHRIYLLIYLVGLSMMMMAMLLSQFSSGAQLGGDSEAGYAPQQATVTVIDRDGNAGTIAGGMRQYLALTSHLVGVADTPQALQDAVATNYTDLIVIIPQGYATAFAEAVAQGRQPTGLQTVTSFTSGVGTMASLQVNGFLAQLRTAYLGLNPPSQALPGAQSADADDAPAMSALKSSSQQVLATARDPDTRPAATVVRTSTTSAHFSAIVYGYALKLGGYPIMASMIISIALIAGVFNERRIQWRIGVSAQKTATTSFGVLAASVLVGLFSVLYYLAVSLFLLVMVGGSVTDMDWPVMLMALASTLCYTAVALALGFLAGQCGASEQAANGFANVFSLLVAFTSGVWFDPSIMPDAMIALGKWLPGWWYSDAVDRALGTGAYLGDSGNVGAWASSTLLVLLFAVAAVCFGLAAGAVRRRYPGWSKVSTTVK